MLLQPGAEYRYNGEHRHLSRYQAGLLGGRQSLSITIRIFTRLEDAWSRPETVIVNEQWWTATARRADIVLPATSPLERTDIMMNRRDPQSCLDGQAGRAHGRGPRRPRHLQRRWQNGSARCQNSREGKSKDDWIRQLWQEAGDVAHQNGFNLPDFESASVRTAFSNVRMHGREPHPVRSLCRQDPTGRTASTRRAAGSKSSRTVIAGFGLDGLPRPSKMDGAGGMAWP